MDLEQINPYDDSYPDFWIKIEHVGRYLYVKDFLAARLNNVIAADISCGFGYGMDILSESCQKIFGVDNNTKILKYLKQHFSNRSNISVHEHNLEKINLNQLSITPNLVISFETLEHLENPFQVLQQFYNILAPKGYLILSIPSENYESLDETGAPKSIFHKQLIPGDVMKDKLKSIGFTLHNILGQSSINQLIRRENKLFRKGKIPQKFSQIDSLQQKNNLISAAYMFAYPDDNAIEKSYSRIYIAKKL